MAEWCSGSAINVNVAADELPTDTATPAGSLSLAAGRDVSRAELLAELLLRLEQRYDAWVCRRTMSWRAMFPARSRAATRADR